MSIIAIGLICLNRMVLRPGVVVIKLHLIVPHVLVLGDVLLIVHREKALRRDFIRRETEIVFILLIS